MSELSIKRVIELCCTIDDMTAEALAFAMEQLYAQGALDVTCASVTMKKSRPGTLLTVICKPEDEERMAQAVMRETTTIGLRARDCRKYHLSPSVRTVETAYGPVRVKCADDFDIHKEKPEYEDVAAIARKTGQSFQTVWETVIRQLN